MRGKCVQFVNFQANQYVVVHTLPTNVVDFVCSVNVVVAVNAPTVKTPAAKEAKGAKAKAMAKEVKAAMAINIHVNDVNSVHAVKAKAADSMDHVVSAIVHVDHVAMKMEISSMAMVMALALPAKALEKVREAKMDARNAFSDAISVDHHADHVAADHHAPAKETMVMPKEVLEAKMVKDRRDNEELDVIIETAHQNKAAPIK